MRAADDELEYEARRGERSRRGESHWDRRDVYRPPEMRSGRYVVEVGFAPEGGPVLGWTTIGTVTVKQR